MSGTILEGGADHPDPAMRQLTARADHGRGMSHFLLQEYPDAEADYRRALTVQGQLTEEFPDQPNYRIDQALLHDSLSQLFETQGRKAEAEAEGQRCAAIAEILPAGLAQEMALARLAWRMTGRGKLEVSVGEQDRLIGGLQASLRQETRPERRTIYRAALLGAYQARAMTRMELKQFAQALPDLDRATALAEDRQRTQLQLW